MKLLITFLITLVPGLVFAANPSLSCGLSMYQFKADQKMFPLIGDSNQRLVFPLNDDGNGGLRGEAQARFLNDQSADPSNSLHGVKAVAIYDDGNGLTISMSILKYENETDQSQFSMVAAVAGGSSFEKSLEDGSKDLTFAHINPKAFDPKTDLWSLVQNNLVEDYELYSISFEGCWLDI